MRWTRSILIVLLLCPVVFVPMVESQEVQGVQVGEPLDLYIRRKPVQDMTYLFFHPPDDGYDTRSVEDPGYRKGLMPKGTIGDSFSMWYPQDRDSNFLQFEPNATLKLGYNITVSAIYPGVPGQIKDSNFTIDVLIELDYENDRKFDREISFSIRDESYSKPTVKEGEINIDVRSLRKFDVKEGGRIKVTFSRADDLDTIVSIYCGYRGYHSYLMFPYSKFRYTSIQEENKSDSWKWMLLFGGSILVGGALILFLKDRGKQKRSVEQPKKDMKKKTHRSGRKT